jgi:hypothetical protein
VIFDMTYLHDQIAAVCPILCLTVGDPNDKTTWSIAYDPSATAAQQQAAQSVLANFNLAAPSPAQQGAALLASGIRIVSTGTPALNGTYAIDDAAKAGIDGIYAGIKDGDGLPGGGSTFNYADLSGAMHAFDATSFPNFARAVRDYLYSISQGQPLPQPVTIP